MANKSSGGGEKIVHEVERTGWKFQSVGLPKNKWGGSEEESPREEEENVRKCREVVVGIE